MTRSLGLALLLLLAAWPAGAITPLPDCSDPPGGRVLCGFDHPEDMAALGDTLVVVSNMGSAERSGRIDMIDFAAWRRWTPSVDIARPDSAWDCGPAPRDMRAGGLDLDGGRLLLVNRAQPARIERYAITRDRLVWTGCVSIPSHLAINDVAWTGPGRFVASHMFDPSTSPPELLAQFRAGTPTGHAVSWAAESGWVAVPGTEVSFANGIAASGGAVWIAGTFTQAVLRHPAGVALALPFQPDNLTVIGDRSLLAAGHSGVPLDGTAGCRELADGVSCGFPFAVAHLQPSNAVEILYSHDGSAIPGASVALAVPGGLLLGTAFGDRVTFVPLP